MDASDPQPAHTPGVSMKSILKLSDKEQNGWKLFHYSGTFIHRGVTLKLSEEPRDLKVGEHLRADVGLER